MQVLERTKKEIESRANTMSDFLRMEYLENCIKKINDIEGLRYCYSELARLYEDRKMYPEALKYLSKFKEMCILQKERIECVKKEVELLIKAGFYERADGAFKEGIKELNESDRFELKRKIIEMYKQEALKLERFSRISGALKIYEKLTHYLTDAEKIEVKKKMLNAYKRLGHVRESLELERSLEREIPGFRKELV
jgi:tetratricopeptide (TPR) repeat protein